MENQTLGGWLGDSAGTVAPMSLFLRALVLRYFSQYYSFCTIGRDFLESVPLGRILLTVDDELRANLHRAIDNGCQAFVVDEPGIEPLLDLFIPVHDSAEQRSLDKRLILLVTEPNRARVLSCIESHAVMREIPNVLIVVYNDDPKPTECYTSRIAYEKGRYDSFNVSLLQLPIDWSDWEGSEFFPDKTTDLNAYALRASFCNYMPFTGYEHVPPGHGNAFDAKTGERSAWLDGTELQLLVSFCERRNCNIFAFFEDEDEWGVVYPNGTGTGLLGSVAERRTDIALAAIYLWYTPYNFTTYTASISRSGVTVLVPKPHMLPFWRTPFLSFSVPLWSTVIATFAAGILVVWVAGQGRYRVLETISGEALPTSELIPFSEVVLMMVGFFVAQSSPMRYDLWSCVFLFTSLLLAGFMVSNLYSAGLASVMTVPQYEKSIDTVVDFAASGMQWYGPTAYCLEEIFNATEPHLKRILTTYKVAKPEDARRYARACDSGFIIEQAQHGNFAPSNFLERDSSTHYQALHDDIYFQNCAALMTKTNPLRAALNEYILQVQQAGILYYWGTWAAIRYLPTDVFRNIENARLHLHDNDQAVTLEIGHFLGAFFILGYGLLCAGVLFIGELWGVEVVHLIKRIFHRATPVERFAEPNMTPNFEF